MKNIRTYSVIAVIGLLLIAEVIYSQFFAPEQLSPIASLTDYRLEIYVIFILTASSIIFFKNEVAASNALTTEFPVGDTIDPIGHDQAGGTFLLDAADGEISIDVTTTLTEMGILIEEKKNKRRETTEFLLPWPRIKRCDIKKPKTYQEGLSEDEMSTKFTDLRAIVHISRGNFPPFKLEIPWTYRFNSQLPREAKLKVGWY